MTVTRKHRIRINLTDDELAPIQEIAGDEDRDIANTIRRLVAEALKARKTKEASSCS